MAVIFKDEHARNYDEWFATEIGRFIDMLESNTALDLLEPQRGMKILDAGCGTGNFCIKLARLGCTVTGVDISPDMLTIARSKYSHGLAIDYLETDLKHLPFSDASFDGVLSMAVFEFVEEIDQVYRELYRVLKPGGKLLIGTINKDSSWGQFYLQNARANEHSIFNKAFLHQLDELKALNPSDFETWQGCLFIPPRQEDADYTFSNEASLTGTARPGFIFAVWKKPAVG